MNARGLVEDLVSNGCELWVRGGELGLRGPPEVLGPEVVDRLRSSKDEIVDLLLRERDGATHVMEVVSPGQAELFEAWRLAPESPVYNLVVAARVSGVLSLPRLQAAFSRVCNDNPALRSTFSRAANGVRQCFHAVVDASVDVEREASGNISQEAQAYGERPFDLERGPACRLAWLAESNGGGVLIFAAHHIVCDGASAFEVFTQLRQRYADAGGEGPGVGFDQYLRKLGRALTGPEQTAADAWYAEQVARPPPLRMALRVPDGGPSAPIFDGDIRTFVLEGDDLGGLKALARAAATTTASAITGVASAALARLTGNDDLLWGMPAHGRTTECARTVGHFVNLQPLRLRVGEHDTLTEVCRTAFQASLAAQKWTVLPMAGGAGRGGGYDEPFAGYRAVIGHFKAPANDLLRALMDPKQGARARFGDVEVQALPVTQQLGQFDLYIECFELVDEIRINFKHRRAACSPAFAAALEREMLRLIRSGSRQPAPEAAMALDDGSPVPGPATTPGDGVDLWEAIRGHADRRGQGVAIDDGARLYTYGQLVDGVSGLARHDCLSNLPPDVPVGLVARRSATMVAAQLWALAQGRRCIVFDADGSDETLVANVSRAGLSYVLMDEANAGRLGDLATATQIPIGEDIFHSGAAARTETVGRSTTQEVLARSALGLARALDLGVDDRIMFLSPPDQAPELSEMWAVLQAGATLVIGAVGQDRSAPEVQQTLIAAGATVAMVGPALGAALWRLPWDASTPLRRLALPTSAGHGLDAVSGCPFEVVGLWGEAGQGWLASRRAGDDRAEGAGGGALPLDGVQLVIGDAKGRALPHGVIGRVYVDSSSGRAATAAEGLLTANGCFALVSADGQAVWNGGWCVDAGVLTAALRSSPGVLEAHGFFEGAAAGRRLLAFVRSDDPGALEGPRRQLVRAAALAGVPCQLTVVDEMPVTRTGAYDETELLGRVAVTGLLAESADGYSPADPVERVVRDVWAEVFETERPSAGADFFALGGRSIDAVKLSDQVSSALGTEVPLRLIFLHPGLQAYAEAIRMLREAGSSPGDRLTSRLERDAVLPEGLVFPTASAARPAGPILLTGATGALGVQMLKALANERRPIIALVRAGGAEEGRQRLVERLTGLGLDGARALAHVTVAAADVSLPDFGLDRAAFEALARSCAKVVHAAADVNFLHPYERLSAANVNGTSNILEFCAVGGVEELHYISTLSVFAGEVYADASPIAEATTPQQPHLIQDGYGQSKWVAEALVSAAGRRGLRTWIHRLGRIVDLSGPAGAADLFACIVKGVQQIGSAPRLDMNYDITPLDYAVRALCVALRRGTTTSRTTHIVNPSPLSWSDFILGVAEGGGRPIAQIPYGEWRDLFLARIAAGQENALTPFAPLFRDASEGLGREPYFSSRETINLLDLHDVLPLSGGGLARAYSASLTRRHYA